jgi:hypothetical protein
VGLPISKPKKKIEDPRQRRGLLIVVDVFVTNPV